MAQATYFSHDINARSDLKMRAMRKKYKNRGYGDFWIIVELLAGLECYQFPLDQHTFKLLSSELECKPDYVERFITDCINEYDLFKSDGKYFWSETLKRRMKKYETFIEQHRAAGRKSAEKRADSNARSTDVQQRCNASQQTKLNKTKLNITKDIGYSSVAAPTKILTPLEEQKPLEEPPRVEAAAPPIDHGFLEIQQTIEAETHKPILSTDLLRQIGDYKDSGMPLCAFKYAAAETALRNTDYPYFKKIIEGMFAAGVKSEEDLNRYKAERERKNQQPRAGPVKNNAESLKYPQRNYTNEQLDGIFVDLSKETEDEP
jgi:hypothetical protein